MSLQGSLPPLLSDIPQGYGVIPAGRERDPVGRKRHGIDIRRILQGGPRALFGYIPQD